MSERFAPTTLIGQALDLYVGSWLPQLLIYALTFAIAVGVALIADVKFGMPQGTVVLITVLLTGGLLFLVPVGFVMSRRFVSGQPLTNRSLELLYQDISHLKDISMVYESALQETALARLEADRLKLQADMLEEEIMLEERMIRLSATKPQIAHWMYNMYCRRLKTLDRNYCKIEGTEAVKVGKVMEELERRLLKALRDKDPDEIKIFIKVGEKHDSNEADDNVVSGNSLSDSHKVEPH